MLSLYFTNIFHTFIGLYYLVRECRHLQELATANTQRIQQTLPPSDEFLFITLDRPTIEYQPEESPNTPVKTQQKSLVFTEDSASVEFKLQQETCEAFIHQDLTFLQPFEIYTTSTES